MSHGCGLVGDCSPQGGALIHGFLFKQLKFTEKLLVVLPRQPLMLSDIKPGTDNVLIRAKLHGPFEPIRGPSDSLYLFGQLCLVQVLLEYAFEELFCKVISETFKFGLIHLPRPYLWLFQHTIVQYVPTQQELLHRGPQRHFEQRLTSGKCQAPCE